MSKNILILHGWNASPDLHFFPKAKEKFEQMGYRVEIPALSGGYFPKLDRWLEVIKNLKPDENWVLIGHSLGGVALLKYLETAARPVRQTILLAVPFEAMDFEGIENFFAGGFDWEKIRANCPRFNLLYETDDPVVEKEHGQKYAQNLKGELTIVPGGMHLHNIDLEMLSKLIEP